MTKPYLSVRNSSDSHSKERSFGMTEAYLSIRDLSVGYNGRPVVSGMNLNIRKGEITALIGPNGAGKTTILKSLSRTLRVISGSVTLDGRDLTAYSPHELATRMAVILTDGIKSDLLTCRDIVAAGRYPYTGRLGLLTKEDEKKVAESLTAVHALDISEKQFHEISDGQRQRVLLARAICQEPDIILLDEPTSFLDIRHKLELLSLLTSMAHEKNITVVMSLHEIDLAEKVADRIVTVKGGEPVAEGRPEEIFEEENIRRLYDIEKGFFDPLFGNIELAKPDRADVCRDRTHGRRTDSNGMAKPDRADSCRDGTHGRRMDRSGMAKPDRADVCRARTPGSQTDRNESAEPYLEKPEVFVIAGDGRGIPIFRALQKHNIPFATGILYTNDTDYRLARLLAEVVITEKPFCEISDETFMRAAAVMAACHDVIDAGCPIGSINQKLQLLRDIAEREGKLRIGSSNGSSF